MNINVWITSGHMCYMTYDMSIGPRQECLADIYDSSTVYLVSGYRMADFLAGVLGGWSQIHFSPGVQSLFILLTVWLRFHLFPKMQIAWKWKQEWSQ